MPTETEVKPSVETEVVAVDAHGRAPGENVARLPEPKVKPEPVTMEHINARVKEAKAKQAAAPPRPLQTGDWVGALQAISNLQARVNTLEAEKSIEK